MALNLMYRTLPKIKKNNYKDFKLNLAVVLAGHCCYGNLLCHKKDNNVFTSNDWAVF